MNRYGNELFGNQNVSGTENREIDDLKKLCNKGSLTDLASYFKCRKDQIKWNETDVNDETVVFAGVDFDFAGRNEMPRNLRAIMGNGSFENSEITNLGEKLKLIGGSAFFGNSKVTSLGGLEIIGFGADFEDSIVDDLGKLKSVGSLCPIGEKVYLKNSKIRDDQLSQVKVFGEIERE